MYTVYLVLNKKQNNNKHKDYIDIASEQINLVQLPHLVSIQCPNEWVSFFVLIEFKGHTGGQRRPYIVKAF